jgi:hypothetical protein
MSQLYLGGRFRGFLDSGAPNVGGLLYSYESGTTTQKNLYTSASLSTPAAYVPDGRDGQAIVLNARGETQVWLGAGVYTLVHCLPDGSVIDTTDGVQAASGGGSSGPSFADDEIPTGSINGSNKVFLLANAPNPTASLSLYLNGQKLITPADYSLSAQTITTVLAPQTGDVLRASYRY